MYNIYLKKPPDILLHYMSTYVARMTIYRPMDNQYPNRKTLFLFKESSCSCFFIEKFYIGSEK